MCLSGTRLDCRVGWRLTFGPGRVAKSDTTQASPPELRQINVLSDVH